MIDIEVSCLRFAFFDQRRNVTMLLQTVRPNIVQSIRAFRVEDLMDAVDAKSFSCEANSGCKGFF